MSDRASFKIEKAPGSKIRVLHVAPCYYPATKWGGPIFSTKAICDHVAAQPDFHLRVLTTDAAGPKRTDSLMLNARTQTFPAGYEVHYAKRVLRNSTSPRLLQHLYSQIRWADVVHLTGVYNFPTIPTMLLTRIMRKPLVWSPRGALQATADWVQAPNRELKHWVERIIRAVAPRTMVIHATAEMEAVASCRRFARAQCSIIPNSVEIPKVAELVGREWRPEGKLRLAFLSRIHKKKGLELLLEALASLPAMFELAIYGQGSGDYLAQLLGKVQSLGLTGRVEFCGHVEGKAKLDAFRRCDLFVLPSYSENFGIVVAESLANGVPVLTTTATPWANIAARDCGAIVAPETEAIKTALLRLSEVDLSSKGQNGRTWMIAEFSPEIVNRKMIRLYRDLHSVA